MLTTLRVLGLPLAVWGARERGTPTSTADISRRLRVAAEVLGPTYIKLGQIISSGEGLFPDRSCSSSASVATRLPAETFDVVRRVVEEDLLQPLESVFRSFDRTPLAAASIAQVHAATLSTAKRSS